MAFKALTGAAVVVVLGAGLLVDSSVSAGASVSWMHRAAGTDAADGIRRFWTPARMRQAEQNDLSLGREDRDWGPMLGIGGATVSHAPVTDPTAVPYRINGRVFLHIRGGVETCSGTAVDTPSRRVVFTAGHCVNDGYDRSQPPGSRKGAWADKWIFIPAYTNGQAPFGTFTYQELWAVPDWINHSNHKFDVGAVVVGRNEAGQNLEDAVGGATVETGQAYGQDFRIFGYPAGAFRGEVLRRCDSAFLGFDRNGNRQTGGPATLRARCNMARGSSGGGWLIDGGTILNGVTSYFYSRHTGFGYSPYFGAEVQRLYNQVASR